MKKKLSVSFEERHFFNPNRTLFSLGRKCLCFTGLNMTRDFVYIYISMSVRRDLTFGNMSNDSLTHLKISNICYRNWIPLVFKTFKVAAFLKLLIHWINCPLK